MGREGGGTENKTGNEKEEQGTEERRAGGKRKGLGKKKDGRESSQWDLERGNKSSEGGKK